MRLNKPTQLVLRLCKPISKTNCNIEAGNSLSASMTLNELSASVLQLVFDIGGDDLDIGKLVS